MKKANELIKLLEDQLYRKDSNFSSKKLLLFGNIYNSCYLRMLPFPAMAGYMIIE